jgi:hypothetical protein
MLAGGKDRCNAEFDFGEIVVGYRGFHF